ncbi:MAG: hypothetical protein M1130_10430 [Actinobacteria bacterium]|nr:hypothetical protein [Actinomycetota bacterium]
MPVETEKVLAMRCPQCGRLEFHHLQRFSAGPGRSLIIKCTCGAVKFVIGTKNRSDYHLKVACIFCEGYHCQTLPGRRIWSSGGVVDLYCHDTGLELGHIGGEDKVGEIASGRDRELEILINEFGRDEFFSSSKIMYEVLQCLHQMAEKGTLYCQCGNRQVEVKIFSDRLELLCGDCGSVNIIYAENEEDLQVIRQVEEIELVKNGFEYLDSLVRSGKIKKSGGGHNNKT